MNIPPATRWSHYIPVIMLAFLFVALASQFVDANEPGAGASPPQHFDRHIAPLLASRCLECHIGEKPEGGLDLSRRESALAGGDSGAAIVANRPQASLLWQRVDSDEMPPKHPLDDNERRLLKQWLADGAVWGSGPIDPFQHTTDRRAGYDWWSLQPLTQVQPPEVEDANWVRGDIDRFILAQLQQAGLAPSPPADPRTLVRRLYFDLIGLPPTPDEVATFVADPSDAEYERMVDRLLASLHYGARWGRHWLDVARFGESDGFERNAPRPHAWPYRDWVIDALNRDLPYDQFARMQIAGDLLQPGREGAAAVGFLVAGVHNTVVGSSERMKRLARQDELEEIIGTIGQTFLGLTVHCARCHDHKFDPISATEYYRMIACIDGIKHGNVEFSVAEKTNELARIDRQIAEWEQAQRALDAAAREAIQAERSRPADDKPASDDVPGSDETKPPAARRPVPQPFASWAFESDLRDQVGRLHGEAHGEARLADETLLLDGRSAYVRTAPLDRELAEKTLEAWVQLENLDQRGGGVISVETRDGSQFDAIVFGEREPRHWMAGSNSFARTQSFQAVEEDEANTRPVHVAIVYQEDGTIVGYRNGVPYGRPYQISLMRFSAGQAHVVFGLRHGPAGGNKMLHGRILRANLYDRALTADEVAASADAPSDYVSTDAILAWLPESLRARRAALVAQLTQTRQTRADLEAASKEPVHSVVAGKPGAMRVHLRGSVTDLADEVSAGGVAAIAGLDADFQLPSDAGDADRRRTLADWITSPENPLFARVIVNRLWHYHFGTGIVETPSDFGYNGGRPSHPRLLDHLASELHTHGFRLKPLHRAIVLSASYRQASTRNETAQATDANNRLLWRYSPRRIDGEQLRDAMLHVAGALNPQAGGPGYEDVSITANSGTTYYEPIDVYDPSRLRRTVFRFTPRGGRSSILDTFDCPDPSASAPRRSVTTTPLQALSLLNNSLVFTMADRLAARVRDDTRDRETPEQVARQVRRAWWLVLARDPDAEEERLSVQLVQRHGLETLGRALLNSSEFAVIE